MKSFCLYVCSYAISSKELPNFTEWVLSKFNVDINIRDVARPAPEPDEYPVPTVSPGKQKCSSYDILC